MKLSRWLFLTLALALFVGTPAAFATVFNYEAIMDGPSESPPNASPGTGFGTVDYNDVTHMLALNASFSGLLGTTTASHIHAPTTLPFTSTAGVATTTPSFAGFPLGVTSGSFSNTIDLTQASSWNPSYVTANGGTTAGAEAAFASSMATGRSYWNIHTSVVGGGEIRGFLIPVPTPEPTACVLFALGAIGLCGTVGRRRS